MFRNYQRGSKRKRTPSLKRGKRLVPFRKRQRQVSRGQRLSTTIMRQPTGLADRVFVKLRLHVDLLFTNTAGAYASFQIAANSAFDPMQATGTQQGYLFDQYATIYTRYRVHGFGYNVQPAFAIQGISSTSVREITVVPSMQGTAFSNARQASEQPRAKSNRWQVNSGRAPTMKGYFKMHPIMGRTKTSYAVDPDNAALVTSDPINIIYFHIGTSDPVATSDVQTSVQLICWQYVEFFQRQIPASS